ncbi:trifunctional transcriptional regulator/proline dehydrogenase/L-glutamate gamma-semialdehyde dehydrogenase [Rhizosaccharibacter radicis]|uniref:Bifunctional protein PutA n=1 Tax=Rhizosaccharibacter radicis TaxID=2782605 RepID=A0ABT1VWT7_9PROT|nr:trifunctional transcriptional regulator/proline dehydrogenase/L-glutamate gamma-semialdehyde dehydrogenase [Acetobacteraceae bacterium KSS12]
MSTTIGVKIDEELRGRLRQVADANGRTPHWLVKQALMAALKRLEDGASLQDVMEASVPVPAASAGTPPMDSDGASPFLAFARSVRPHSVLRAQVTAAYRRPEPDCLPLLMAEATLSEADADRTRTLATRLVQALRARGSRSGVEALIQQYALSSQEGVALMCLAEALLRIPDRATRDALIRDKIATGDWQSHAGQSPSLFVNAATWGLIVTGKLTATASEQSLSNALTRLIGRGGEPVIRRGVDMAMRMMGEQFVTGQTIGEAIRNSRRMEKQGYRYSYDMLGEAAMTAADAERYYKDYENAVHVIGKASARRGIYEGPGISVKLSALHPRYGRAQQDRVMGELLPRLKALAVLARSYDIGLNIDAEEADRLELSLDLMEALCFAPELAGWNGIGFVVQAYQKRAPFVLDVLIDLARRSGHRLMIRLVKGAYWDSEIKRAQENGLEGFPVFTRKTHTDVSYLACARRLLAAPDAVFPQFATHNAYTLAAIHTMAGQNFHAGQYEFQCLHGMGEPLYDEVVGAAKLNRPCRIYAPVGTHETLLAYLVRRLLENGANTSFVNRINDPAVPVDALVADPVAVVAALAAENDQPVGQPHPGIRLPRDLFGAERPNSAGFDLSNEQRLASLAAAALGQAATVPHAAPAPGVETAPVWDARNPADRRDLVGTVSDATAAGAAQAARIAAGGFGGWSATPAPDRAATLERAADAMEARLPELVALVVREAGKSFSNAVAEIREAVDFLRYYAAQCRRTLDAHEDRPLGPVLCISPWNFPLAIFTGQVSAALAAGNSVIAKPAEETPLVAAEAVRLLHEAGVPADALVLVPGDGAVGAALVADETVRGVMFTGSTEVARAINRTLAARLSPAGDPIPLIAETGGQNALICDSSALAEQAVGDIVASAFDSAGQRCSALRVLCVQEDGADRLLTMLRGAMAELAVGNPDRLSTDVGPVITADAHDRILAHVDAMRAAGHPVWSLPLGPDHEQGSFVAPTLIEISDLSQLREEVFGPVLHVLRYGRAELLSVLDGINSTGYGLTFGVHSRIDETIRQALDRAEAGNCYVNRNLIGAVVGVQPFGGHNLSGTGPKAGGPLYLRRLLDRRPPLPDALRPGHRPRPATLFLEWLQGRLSPELLDRCRALLNASPFGATLELPGPVGERNGYALHPRGDVLCLPATADGALFQVMAALATGNRAVLPPDRLRALEEAGLPEPLRGRLMPESDGMAVSAVLFEGDGDALRAVNQRMAAGDGAVVSVHHLGPATDMGAWPMEWLMLERTVSVNTAAAGGNASLMSIG